MILITEFTGLIALVWEASAVGDSPLYSAAVTELADQDYVGTALSLQMGLGFAISVLVIWLLSIVANYLGSWQWIFVISVPGPDLSPKYPPAHGESLGCIEPLPYFGPPGWCIFRGLRSKQISCL